MTLAALPWEVRDPVSGAPAGVPFDDTAGAFRLARSESGAVFHKPACADFRRAGWCPHLAAAAARAEEPGREFAADVRAYLDEWEAEGFRDPVALVWDRMRTVGNKAIEADHLRRELLRRQAEALTFGEDVLAQRAVAEFGRP